MGRAHGASRGLAHRSFTNELPDFSSSITTARVAAFFKPRPTGLLLKKTGVYSAKRNTGTEIRKFVVEARIVPPIRGNTHHGNGAFDGLADCAGARPSNATNAQTPVPIATSFW